MEQRRNEVRKETQPKSRKIPKTNNESNPEHNKVRKKRKGKSKRRKKNTASAFLYSLDFPRLLRLMFFLLIGGIIVYQYYLLTENKLASSYIKFWSNSKNFLVPAFMFIGYTLIIFLLGYRVGKRR